MLKLYVVVRNDIDVPFQMCQVAHAVADLSTKHPDEFRAWNKGNNTICVLQVPSDRELAKLVEAAEDGGLKHAAFYEPDWDSLRLGENSDGRIYYVPDNGPWLTAVAFTPDWFVQHLLLAGLPLALDRSTVRLKHGLPEGKFQVVNPDRYRELMDTVAEVNRLRAVEAAWRSLMEMTPKQRRTYFKNLKKGQNR